MLEILSGFPDDVAAVSARGDVSEDDYRNTLVPYIDSKLKAHAEVRVFCHIGPEFTGFTAGAMWEDTKLGLGRWNHWGCIAIVTDVGWLKQAVRLFSPFFRHPVRTFANAEYDTAREWINAPDAASKAA